MKICYIALGNNIHTIRWIEAFRDMGHDVSLISFSKSLISGIRNFDMYPDNETIYFPHKGFLKFRKVRRIIKELNPDILHVHYASSYGLMCALSADRPYVLSTWGADIFDFPAKTPLHSRLVRYVVNRAGYITATSRMLAEGTRWFLKNKEREIRVIPFGVDLSLFKPLPEARHNNGKLVIGTVKALKPKYGIDHLIRAFAELRKSRDNISLFIAGRGEQETHLRNLAGELGVADRTTFVGFIDNKRVPEAINGIDVFVVPSVFESETFGVAAVEASACEVPVVASDIGGLPEVVIPGKNGLLAEPGNPEDLASKIGSLLDDASLRSRMGTEGRKFVARHYDWNENTAEMDRLYRDITGSK